MGLANAGVFIKLEKPNDFTIEEVVRNLFGDYSDIESKWGDGFDFRNKENLIISYHPNGIRIMNSELVEQVLEKRSPEIIQKLYNYFNSPALMMVYMHYDSGDSFGFGCIEDGMMTRFRYSVSTDWVTHDFGLPFDEELNILNGRLYYEEHEEGEREYLYNRLDYPDEPRSYDYINSDIANEVMLNKIGFGLEDVNPDAKTHYVTLKPKEKLQPQSEKKKPKGFLGKLFGQ